MLNLAKRPYYLFSKKGKFSFNSFERLGTFYAKGQSGPLIDRLFDDCVID